MSPANGRPTVLWRASNWHCVCLCESFAWTVRLFVDTNLVNELAIDNVRDMLAIADHWRASVASDPAGAQRGDIVSLRSDRRANRSERRAAPRGGRRHRDGRQTQH